jgi:hypothetical protein
MFAGLGTRLEDLGDETQLKADNMRTGADLRTGSQTKRIALAPGAVCPLRVGRVADKQCHVILKSLSRCAVLINIDPHRD